MIDLETLTSDDQQLRRAFGCFPTGVTAICAMINGEPVGMSASSFTSVSVVPPLVSICVQSSSTTWPKLRAQSRLGLSVLSEEHGTACRRLSLKQGDRFDGVDWEADTEGGVFIGGASAWLDCSLYSEVPAGDHAIALLKVHRLQADPERPPLVFHASQFRRLAAV